MIFRFLHQHSPKYWNGSPQPPDPDPQGISTGWGWTLSSPRTPDSVQTGLAPVCLPHLLQHSDFLQWGRFGTQCHLRCPSADAGGQRNNRNTGDNPIPGSTCYFPKPLPCEAQRPPAGRGQVLLLSWDRWNTDTGRSSDFPWV